MDGRIHQFLLSQQGMRQFRSALIERNEYFFHQTTWDKIPDIKSLGLLPHDPEDFRFSSFVENGIAIPDRKIACFSPSSSEVFVSGKYGFRDDVCTVAIKAIDLPNRVGSDYSYSPIFERMSIEFENMKDEDLAEDAMIESAVRNAHKYGSIVSYDIVDPSVLLVISDSVRPGEYSALTYQSILQL